MLPTIVIAALMAGAALAKPLYHQKLHQKRDVVIQTEYKIVYEYVYVTKTEGAASATAVVDAAAASVVTTSTTATSSSTFRSFASHSHHHGKSSTKSSFQSSSTSYSKSFSKPTTSPTPSSTVAPVTTVVVPTSSAPASPSTTGPLSFEDIVLLHHNVHRTNHSAPALTWNSTLAQIAQDEASACVYAHNTAGGGGGYGQNIAAGVEAGDISAVITDMMYNGEMTWYAGQYGLTNPSFDNFEHWGHFSQIVWKETASVGCAVVHCPNGLANVGSNVAPYFTVCNYFPPGNMGGSYGTNIGAPLGESSVFASYGL